MVKAIHLQNPATRNTIRSTDGSMKVFLQDDMQLLLKPKSVDYPFPLDVQTVHALLNMLWINREAIISEASKYNGEKQRGYPERWT